MPLDARHTGMPLAVPQVVPLGQPTPHPIVLPPVPPVLLLVLLEVEDAVVAALPACPPAPLLLAEPVTCPPMPVALVLGLPPHAAASEVIESRYARRFMERTLANRRPRRRRVRLTRR
jgi:hypothetical protein